MHQQILFVVSCEQKILTWWGHAEIIQFCFTLYGYGFGDNFFLSECFVHASN